MRLSASRHLQGKRHKGHSSQWYDSIQLSITIEGMGQRIDDSEHCSCSCRSSSKCSDCRIILIVRHRYGKIGCKCVLRCGKENLSGNGRTESGHRSIPVLSASHSECSSDERPCLIREMTMRRSDGLWVGGCWWNQNRLLAFAWIIIEKLWSKCKEEETNQDIDIHR